VCVGVRVEPAQAADVVDVAVGVDGVGERPGVPGGDLLVEERSGASLEPENQIGSPAALVSDARAIL
jgi:hypothetical protein